MLWLDPITAPVALVAAAHAWIIPELYAARGATVATPRARAAPPRKPSPRGCSPTCSATASASSSANRPRSRARPARDLAGGGGRRAADQPRWQARARLLRRATDSELPPSDRVAHLLLALRVDEEGFATVANHAFAGAPWRVRSACPSGCARPSTRPARPRGCRPPGRASLGGCGIRRRNRRRGLRRVVRGAPAGAPSAPRQRAHPADQRRQLHALHAAAARRRRRLAGAASRRGAAARGARLDRPAPRARHRRRSEPGRDPRPDGRRPRRDAPLRPADRHARLGVARAAGAGAGRARPRLQDALRRDRAAQPRPAQPRDRGVAAARRGPGAPTSASCS